MTSTDITLDGIDTAAVAQRSLDARNALHQAQKNAIIAVAIEMSTDALEAFPNARYIELGDSDQGYDRVWAERILDDNHGEILDGPDEVTDAQEVIDGMSDLASYLPSSKPSFLNADGRVTTGTDHDYDWYIEDKRGNRYIDIAAALAHAPRVH